MNDQGPETPRPGGTVYGRGAVDVRDHRQGGFLTRLNPLVTVGVLVGVIAVFALGYGVWRANSGATAEAAAVPAAPATSTPAPAAPLATAAPAELGIGSWYLAPLGDPDTTLTVDNGYAAMSASEKMVLTAISGLADDKCFTFQGSDGRYLRHFDYRLKFDLSDNSDLFRKDATFCPEAGLSAGTLRLHSSNYPDYWLHRRGTEVYIDRTDDSDEFTKDSSFMVVAPS